MGFLRNGCIFFALLVSVYSFQNTRHVKSISGVTKYREERRGDAGPRSFTTSSQTRDANDIGSMSKVTTTIFLSNNGSNMEGNNNYNDDAFGFVFLGGYIVTRDAVFAGTFLLLSALAAIATRNGKLPATNSVPAAVAGCTFIVNLITPNDELYQLFASIERSEPFLPVDVVWVKLGFCAVSMIYGFMTTSSHQKENPKS